MRRKSPARETGKGRIETRRTSVKAIATRRGSLFAMASATTLQLAESYLQFIAADINQKMRPISFGFGKRSAG